MKTYDDTPAKACVVSEAGISPLEFTMMGDTLCMEQLRTHGIGQNLFTKTEAIELGNLILKLADKLHA